MLELLRSDVALFLALCGILIAMFFPIAAVWIAFSIRRDIHRIADALTDSVERPVNLAAVVDRAWMKARKRDVESIVPSAFGR